MIVRLLCLFTLCTLTACAGGYNADEEEGTGFTLISRPELSRDSREERRNKHIESLQNHGAEDENSAVGIRYGW